MKRALFVVSLQDGKGPTGVETHFNGVIAAARASGIDARLVCPHPATGLRAKLASLAAHAIARASRERAELFRAWVAARVIGRKLAGMLAQMAERDRSVTLYAQDPLSAQVALKLKTRRPCRVVLVIHYNVSVAHELRMKGETTASGPLWRHAVRTEQAALPHVDAIVFVSDFMRRIVLERLPVLARVPHTVIPNFVSGAPLHESRAPLSADVIAIGSLEPRKNQAFLLHVIAKANALGFRYTLTLVGNGPDEARLVALADELGVAAQVRFAGFQKQAASLIARHRVLAHAAHIENMPITLIEALAAGKPVLAPAVGGIPEIFTHAVEGYYWSLDNVDEAARLLIQALGDSPAYERLARAALARYKSAFDGDVLAPRWLTAILDSVALPNAGAEANRAQDAIRHEGAARA